jgi:hypothetical protein
MYHDYTPRTPKMSFTLPPIREMLPKIREAYDNKTLQMFRKPGEDGYQAFARYNGPCAIGVCMTHEQKDYGDNNEFNEYGLYCLIENNIVVGLDPAESFDITELQAYHDRALNLAYKTYEEHEAQIARFGAFLTMLEEKYGCSPQ